MATYFISIQKGKVWNKRVVFVSALKSINLLITLIYLSSEKRFYAK